MPPDMSGSAMASDSSPSSGIWNIMAWSVVARRKVAGIKNENSRREQGEQRNKPGDAGRAPAKACDQLIELVSVTRFSDTERRAHQAGLATNRLRQRFSA